MIDPKLLCQKHLLGEHFELHMLAGAIKKGKNLKGYIDKGYVELDKIGSRHKKLVREMKRRSYKHKSPLRQPYVRHYKDFGRINIFKSMLDLMDRCDECGLNILFNSNITEFLKKINKSLKIKL